MAKAILFLNFKNKGTSQAGAATVLAFAGIACWNSSSNTMGTNHTPSYCEEIHKSKAMKSKNDNKDVTNDKKSDWFYDYFPKSQLWKPSRAYPAWDDNWDSRKSKSSKNTKNPNDRNNSTVTRHIILVRHGQYDETYPEDEKRVLTKLGREQADMTGRRLAEMFQGKDGEKRPSIKTIRVSNMTRAKETAEIISKHLPMVSVEAPDPLLNEGLPAQVIPVRPELEIDKHMKTEHGPIEKAFQKYVYRASKSDSDDDKKIVEEDDEHEFEIIVCHGNVIRYFFCRALQIPPEAWLRMSTFNCSLTYLLIRPNGNVSCRLMGDIGHLGYDQTTFSMYHGLDW